ncbi:MAG: tetratricopeptide repeat protein [candidate division WOR-3 bacterium]
MRLAILILVIAGLPVFAQTTRSGLLLEQAGQLERALKEFRDVLEKNPDDLNAYQGLLRVAARLGRYDTLVAVSQRLSGRNPDKPDFALGLIEGLFGSQRNNAAVAESRAVMRRWPERVLQLAGVLKKWREFGTAIELLSGRRSELSPNDPSLSTIAAELVELYGLNSQPVLAAKEIVGIVNQWPGMAEGYIGRLGLLATRSNGQQLLSELSKIGNVRLRAKAQATVYIALNREREAVQVMRDVASDQELYQFAHECEAQGALTAALLIYQEQKAHADQARILRRLGRLQEALAILALDQGTGAMMELGDLRREALRDYQGAAEAYRKVLKQRPGYEPALFGLASAQLGLGDLTGARTTLAQLSQPTDRSILLEAKLAFYQERFDSVPVIVQKLATQFPKSPLVNDGLELALLTQSSGDLAGLAKALLDYEADNHERGKARARALAKGKDEIAARAALLLAQFLRREGRPKEAVAELDTLLGRFPKSRFRARAMLEQARIFYDDLRDEGRFREKLEELILAFPGSPYAPLARSILATTKVSVEPGGIH